ncbi:Hypothetical protein SMAX5B_014702 [Scophthalmus maximus]|uniref:Uncharacterized protein n=1 Tax=Scophthalmus maximus TaxID=52904 RepID=A0A2U9C1J6_SCOMX|nr:Hypothetical protein SMAX5B_014702 [Scophthalmus maximus]
MEQKTCGRGEAIGGEEPGLCVKYVMAAVPQRVVLVLEGPGSCLHPPTGESVHLQPTVAEHSPPRTRTKD